VSFVRVKITTRSRACLRFAKTASTTNSEDCDSDSCAPKPTRAICRYSLSGPCRRRPYGPEEDLTQRLERNDSDAPISFVSH
jgi:hypothetical protein